MAERGKRKIRKGIIVSDKMDKTAVVRVYRTTRHPFYGKVVKRSSKFKAHNQENMYKKGDKVVIVETRPLSKEKRWRIVKKI